MTETATPAIDGWFTTGPDPALVGTRCTTCETVYFPRASGFCRNPACVNPDHLEPVSIRENLLRGVGPSAQHAKKTHCPAGHSYAGKNL